MMSDGGRDKPDWARLGRVDPWVWFMVIPVLAVSLLFFFGGVPLVGVLVVLFGGLVILFDSWSNRPDLRAPAPARAQARRPAQPQGRPRAPRQQESARSERGRSERGRSERGRSERAQASGRYAEPTRQAPRRPARGAQPGAPGGRGRR
ncbi:hypothetical protein [Parasphingorhabdus pacifica]